MKARTQEVRDTSARGCIQTTCDGAKLINQRTGLNFGKDYIKELITDSSLFSFHKKQYSMCLLL